MSSMLIAIVLFLVVYIIMLTEKVHRTSISLAGAGLLLLLGVVNQEQAIEAIDFNMLGILVGMMVIVGISKHSGLFQYVAIWAAKAGKGKPLPIFILLGCITVLFSAILDDVTTALLMVPVTFVIAHNLRISPKPFLVSAILLANFGGASTLIGDQPNILIGSAADLSFNAFLVHMAPIALTVSALTIAGLAFVYRKEMTTDPEAIKDIMKFEPKDAITNWSLLYKSLLVIGLVVLGFITHSATGLEGATIALSGAALLLILTMDEPDRHICDIEWTTIFFFIGLFILVLGLEHTGVVEILAHELINITQGSYQALALAVIWGSAIFSAVVDNVPFVVVMIPLLEEVGQSTGLDIQNLWWALAMGASFGGNATLIGASANVVVSGMAEKAGYKIRFFDFMKIGVPFALIATILASLYFGVRYF